MRRWNLVIDVAECENCNNCVLAAKDELVGNLHAGYSAPHPKQGQGVIQIQRQTHGKAPMVDSSYVPHMCNHCDDAPCIRADALKGGNAVRKREDGIVIFDPDHAKGRKDLVDACPYGAVVWNAEEGLPQTWFFDAHLLDKGWGAPRIVAVCPTGAIQALKIPDAEMSELEKAQKLRVLKPELETKPRIYYRNLDRFDRLFIGGALEVESNGVVDCVEGIQVELWQGPTLIHTTTSDAFGEYRFDALDPHSGEYVIRVLRQQASHIKKYVELLGESIVMDPIELT